MRQIGDSASHLSYKEYCKVIERFNYLRATKYKYFDKAPVYNTIRDTMKSMEKQGIETRVVFWFDN